MPKDTPTELVITQQFCGPPNSGNGGYVSGLLAKPFDGVATAVLRAPPPLNTPLFLKPFGDGVRLENADGDLIGEGRPGDVADITAFLGTLTGSYKGRPVRAPKR